MFTFAWVIVGGLLLQLVVLPHLPSSIHFGHGLIADLDSIAYHTWGAELARRIDADGWRAWELRPRGHVMTAVAAIFYRLIRPEPWAVLPFNGLMFATAVTATRRALATAFDSERASMLGIVPFFLFPSFVPIWGQLQKDVVTGAGLSVVVCGVVMAGRAREAAAVIRALALSLLGLLVVWLARPYGVLIAATAAALCGGAGALPHGNARKPIALVVGAMVLGALVSVEPWQLRGSLPVAAGDVEGAASREVVSADWERESAERARMAIERINVVCAPQPSAAVVDRLMFSICTVRSNYIINAERVQAGSGYDYDKPLRSVRDFLGYAPVAIGYGLLAPWPGQWGSGQTPIGRLASVLVPFEMLVAYAAFALAGIAAYRRAPPAEACGLMLFTIVYGACFALATPQLGTLYRMRAFPFVMLIGAAISLWASRRAAGSTRTELEKL